MSSIWINTGEYSGDLQASVLLKALKKRIPDLKAYGMGGPNLQSAGQINKFSINELSVMGIVEVLTAIPRAIKLLRGIKKELSVLRPELVVLVDAPDFNFRVAKIAHKLGLRTCYFIPPKVWAWRSGRIKFLKKYVETVISILPFEVDFYKKHGMAVEYFGNPLIDRINWEELQTIETIKDRIGLMPGSRKNEIKKLLPELGRAAKIVLDRYPNLKFFCIRAPNLTEEFLREHWQEEDIPLEIESPENRYNAMRTCKYILGASGTATLETALVGVPTIIIYKVSLITELLGRMLLRVRWVGLPNLILGKELFPELLQRKANGITIAEVLSCWIDNPGMVAAIEEDLTRVRQLCSSNNSTAGMAEYIDEKFFR